MTTPALHSPATWRPFVEALLATSPEGTAETTFTGHFFPGSWGGITLDDGANELRHAARRSPGADPVDAAAESIRALVGELGCYVSIKVRHAGASAITGEVTVAELPDGTTMGSGAHDVSVVAFSPGSVPEPYRRIPTPIHGVAESPAADPALVTALVRAALPDATGLSPAELDALPSALPADVRALFAVAGDGDLILSEQSRGLVSGAPERGTDPDDGEEEEEEEWRYVMRIVSPADAASRSYLTPQARAGSWRFAADEVVPPDPFERVQAVAASGAWYQIGGDWGGSSYVVDLAPGPRGTLGQVLFIAREQNSGAQWVAPSLTEFLVRRPTEFAAPGPADDLLVRISAHSGLDPAAITDATEVLKVAKGTDPVDAALAGRRRLRTLSLAAGTITDPGVLAALPALEYLELSAEDWQRLLRDDAVPPGLLAAGILDADDFETHLDIVARLLAARGDDETAQGALVTRFTLPEPPADPAAAAGPAPAVPPSSESRPSWLRRLFGSR